MQENENKPLSRKRKDVLLNRMGFEKICTNQYLNGRLGAIFLRDEDTEKDICIAIFNLGRHSKMEEIKKTLGL